MTLFRIVSKSSPTLVKIFSCCSPVSASTDNQRSPCCRSGCWCWGGWAPPGCRCLNTRSWSYVRVWRPLLTWTRDFLNNFWFVNSDSFTWTLSGFQSPLEPLSQLPGDWLIITSLWLVNYQMNTNLWLVNYQMNTSLWLVNYQFNTNLWLVNTSLWLVNTSLPCQYLLLDQHILPAASSERKIWT